MAKRNDYVYMAVTKDKYELPLFVADSTKELAEMMGLPHKTVSMYMSPVNQNNRKNSGFVKVYIGDLDDDE